MSNILQNANLYNTSNTQRVDVLGQNTGQLVAGKVGVIGFDCSGYFYHVLRESGYNVTHTSALGFQQSSNFQDVSTTDVRPGDAVFFDGHVGFVVSYNPDTGAGVFRSMTGSKNVGQISDAPFSTKNSGTAQLRGQVLQSNN